MTFDELVDLVVEILLEDEPRMSAEDKRDARAAVLDVYARRAATWDPSVLAQIDKATAAEALRAGMRTVESPPPAAPRREQVSTRAAAPRRLPRLPRGVH